MDSEQQKDGNDHGLNDDWKGWTEADCETLLETNPFDNHARYRLAEIWMSEGFNIDDAVKLLDSVQKSNPTFMVGEIKMLYGDQMSSPLYNDYPTAIKFYLESAEYLKDNSYLFTQLGLTSNHIKIMAE